MRRIFKKAWLAAVIVLISSLSQTATAGQARVAVASNFYATAQTLQEAFYFHSPHRIILSTGSTGKHFAQIQQGAPFDLFLAADHNTPAKLSEAGVGVAGSLATYAIGNLVLWQPLASTPEQALETLKSGRGRLAIANPKLAPYGRAAEDVIAALNLGDTVRNRLVTGENVSQAFQFIATGNAEAGFIARSQFLKYPESSGQVWLVPPDLHAPIVQKMLLLTDSEAAQDFYTFLRSPTAVEIIKTAGYSVNQ